MTEEENHITEKNLMDTKSSEKKCPVSSRTMISFFLLFLIIAAISVYVFFESTEKNSALLGHVVLLEERIKKYHDEQINQEKILQNTEEALKQLETTFGERNQMFLVRQDADSVYWVVAEAYYFVKLANDCLQFLSNVEFSKQLLQKAEMILKEKVTKDTLILDQAVEKNLEEIEAVKILDIDGLYAELLVLNNTVQNLPLRINNFSSLSSDVNPLVTKEGQIHQENITWWQNALDHIKKRFNEIVVVHYDPQGILVANGLIEKSFLYQRIHTLFLNAMWGLLYQNDAVYQGSLDQLYTLVTMYCLQESSLTADMLKKLLLLKSISLKYGPLPHVNDTLQLFQKFFASKLSVTSLEKKVLAK